MLKIIKKVIKKFIPQCYLDLRRGLGEENRFSLKKNFEVLFFAIIYQLK